MNTIPLAEVRQTWARLTEASPQQTRAMAERMRKQEPYLMVYLLANEENLHSGEEAGWLLLLGGLIFEAMTGGNRVLREVTPEEIEAAERANLRFFARLDEGPELAQFDAMGQLFRSYNQMPLLGTLLEMLMEGHEAEPELAPEHIGLALLHLKTVIDCLDQ